MYLQSENELVVVCFVPDYVSVEVVIYSCRADKNHYLCLDLCFTPHHSMYHRLRYSVAQYLVYFIIVVSISCTNSNSRPILSFHLPDYNSVSQVQVSCVDWCRLFNLSNCTFLCNYVF